MTLAEFFSRLGITEKDAKKAFKSVEGSDLGCPHYRSNGCKGSWRCGLRLHDGYIVACDPAKVSGCPYGPNNAGVKGEFYPCKPDIFAATYKPADDIATNALSIANGAEGMKWQSSVCCGESVHWDADGLAWCGKCKKARSTHCIVDVDELKRCFQYFMAINMADLDEIIWIRDGKRLRPDRATLEKFAFTGLSNKDFPEYAGWLDDPSKEVEG
jgi:hypothetical protein